MIQDLRIKQIKKSGFTLVELLVVISIIGILTMVTVGSFSESQKKSRDAARKANLKSLSDALNLFYADNGSFPDGGSGVNSIPTLIGNEREFSANYGVGKTVVYMKKVPKENSSSVKQIVYHVSSTGKAFRLYTNLENDKDKDCVGGSVCSGLGYTINNDCCYIITSSNVGSTSSSTSWP